MSNQSLNPMSKEQFEALVGAPIPSQSQEIPAFVQNSFKVLAGQIAKEMAGPDGEELVGQIKVSVDEIGSHYNLSLPQESDDVVSFVTQLAQLWVPEQLPDVVANDREIDETITKIDPEQVSYPLNPPGSTQPKGSLNVPNGGLATVSTTFDWSKLTRTPLDLPAGKSHATRIQISATGRPITTIIIWNLDKIVDRAPSLHQFHKGKKFPLQKDDPGYIFAKPCTHIQVFTSNASEWEYHVEVEA